MQKTAVQQIIDRLEKLSFKYSTPGILVAIEISKSLLQTEEDQIINSHFQGQFDDTEDYPMRKAEQYYNKTFKKNK